MKELRHAIDLGYRRIENLRTNPAFEETRERDDFKQLIDALREKANGGTTQLTDQDTDLLALPAR